MQKRRCRVWCGEEIHRLDIRGLTGIQPRSHDLGDKIVEALGAEKSWCQRVARLREVYGPPSSFANLMREQTAGAVHEVLVHWYVKTGLAFDYEMGRDKVYLRHRGEPRGFAFRWIPAEYFLLTQMEEAREWGSKRGLYRDGTFLISLWEGGPTLRGVTLEGGTPVGVEIDPRT